MKTSRAMPFDIGDYLSDTMGLSREEHGSYCLLIMAYWKNGGPLPNEDERLRQIAMCPPREWPATKSVLRRFFDTNNGTWRQKRLDLELLMDRQRQAAIERASAAGVERRRELGQIPPVESSVQPSVSRADRISIEKQIPRIEKRIEYLRSIGKLSVEQSTEKAILRDRLKDLKKQIGWVA